MGQLSFNQFPKWLEKNPSKLSEIYNAERQGFAKANFIEWKTPLDLAVVKMVDPSDPNILLETFLVAISDEPIDKNLTQVAETHLKMVNESIGGAPVSELFIRVDDDLNTLDYSIINIPTS
jgi:hypothetical protein